jgi:hypothetical protein
VELLGVRLGDRLLPGDASNPKGYFEDEEVVELNTALLHAGGTSAFSLRRPQHEAWRGPAAEGMARVARALVARREAAGGPWGFKDPRTCLTLPFWQGLLRKASIPTGYVLVIRHPLSVAASLERRNGLGLRRSLLLWLLHTSSSLRYTRGLPRVLVDYDRLLDDPAAQVRRMAQALALTVDEGGEAALKEYATTFIDPGLRHHATRRGPWPRSLASAAARTLYGALGKRQSGPPGPAADLAAAMVDHLWAATTEAARR